MTKLRKYKIILLILVFFIFLKLINFNFPFFTPDEALLSLRGETITKYGKDELGRSWPLFFNSSDDYVFPLLSYLTAVGILIGGHEFSVRILFLLINIMLIYFCYLVAKKVSSVKHYPEIVALIVSLSPVIFFLSNLPSEPLIYTAINVLIFYLLINKKIILWKIIPVVILSFLVSKISMFTTVPLIIFVLYKIRPDLNLKMQKNVNHLLLLSAIFFLVVILLIFWKSPNPTRSILENNLTIFSDLTLQNGINHLRGLSITSGWPVLLSRLFFSKMSYLIVGILHWWSNLTPAVLFGIFDPKGLYAFSGSGMFSKILIIPLLFGLYHSLKKGVIIYKDILFVILILSFPILFNYPYKNLYILTGLIPFISLIIAVGLVKFGSKFKKLIIALATLEIVFSQFASIGLIGKSIQASFTQNLNDSRPVWIKGLVGDINKYSSSGKVFVSENISPNVINYIMYISNFDKTLMYSDVVHPYKYSVTNTQKIAIITSQQHFFEKNYVAICPKSAGYENLVEMQDSSITTKQCILCKNKEKVVLFVDDKFLKSDQLHTKYKIIKTFIDDIGQVRAYLIMDNLCFN